MNRSTYLLAALGLLGPVELGLAQATNALTLHADLPEVGLSAARSLAALAIVLAVFFAGVWLFRNGQRVVWRKTGPPRLAILESRSLGNRYALYVVAYEQQRLLIGSSPAGLNLLSPLPPGVTEEPVATATSQPGSFADSLRQMLKRS